MSTSEPGQQSPADTGSAHPAGSVDGTLPSPLTGETAPVTDRAPLAKDLSAPGITHGHTWVDDDEDLGEYVPGQYSDEPDEGSSTAGRTGGVPTLAAPQVAPEVMPRVIPSLRNLVVIALLVFSWHSWVPWCLRSFSRGCSTGSTGCFLLVASASSVFQLWNI